MSLFVFGIYLVVTVIVLLNLLIAMMSNTYQRIHDQSDAEWKFGRAILIRDISCRSETPSPFNLLICVSSCVKFCYKRGGRSHAFVHISVKLRFGEMLNRVHVCSTLGTLQKLCAR